MRVHGNVKGKRRAPRQLQPGGEGVDAISSDAAEAGSNPAGPEVVVACLIYLARHDVAGPEPLEALVDEEVAVDLRRVGPGPAGRALVIDRIDDGVQPGADLRRELGGGDRLRLLHEAVPALLLHRLGNMVGKGVRTGAADVLVPEAADPVELRLVEPVEQGLELSLGLPGVADDEGGAERDAGADGAPRRDFVERLRGGSRPRHALQRI